MKNKILSVNAGCGVLFFFFSMCVRVCVRKDCCRGLHTMMVLCLVGKDGEVISFF